MKKFTFLITVFLIVLFASAQNKSDLQTKFQQAHEKISKIAQRTSLLSKLAERQALNAESFLKSAATKQKLDSIVEMDLDATTQTWQNGGKEEFIYNSEMKNTSWLFKEWDVSTQAWDIWEKTELEYNNQGNISSMLTYMSIETGQAPILTSKFVNFYNSQGIPDSTLSYSTENAGVNWVLEIKQINYYNASKQLIKVDIWVLDEDLGVLTLGMNVVYTYNTSGKIITSSSNYIMEGEEMLWSKTDYNYDANGKLISTEDWHLSFQTFVLEKTYRSAYQYNATGDISIEIYSKWNGTAWEDMEKNENIYSTTNFSDVIFPEYYYLFGMNEATGLSYNKVITDDKLYEMSNGSWKNTGKSTYHYSAATSTNIDELANTLFTVYPNPTSEQVNFSWKGNYESLSLEMYQITGAKVLEQIVYSAEPVSISKLENGIYFFRLLNGHQLLYSGKFLKE